MCAIKSNLTDSFPPGIQMQLPDKEAVCPKRPRPPKRRPPLKLDNLAPNRDDLSEVMSQRSRDEPIILNS